MYRGGECKAAVDCDLNLYQLYHHAADDMALSLHDQYYELNGTTLLQFKDTVPPTVLVLPKSGLGKGFATFCVPESGANYRDKTITMPVLRDANGFRSSAEYLGKWLPLVRGGLVTACVLTKEKAIDWPAYNRELTTHGPLFSLGQDPFNLVLEFLIWDTAFNSLDAALDLAVDPDQTTAAPTTTTRTIFSINSLKSVNKTARSYVEDGLGSTTNLRFLRHVIVGFTDIKHFGKPFYLDGYKPGDRTNEIDLSTHTKRAVHCPEATDLAALQHMNGQQQGNATCACHRCKAAKSDYQKEPVSEETANSDVRTYESHLMMFEQVCMSREDSDVKVSDGSETFIHNGQYIKEVGKIPDPKDRWSVHNKPIFMPPPDYVVPIPLHTGLGLGNGLRDLWLAAVRLMDGAVGKKVAAFVKQAEAKMAELKEAIKNQTKKLRTSKDNLRMFLKCYKDNGSDIRRLIKSKEKKKLDLSTSELSAITYFEGADELAAIITTDIARKKTELREWPARLKDLARVGKLGDHEIWWTDLLIDNGIRSEVYHGGDWAGDACRNFLGVTTGRSKERKDYQDFTTLLKERIEQTMPADENSIADVVDGVSKLQLLQYVDVLHGCSERLAAAHSFYSKIVPFKDNQELVAGIWACKQHCSYY